MAERIQSLEQGMGLARLGANAECLKNILNLTPHTSRMIANHYNSDRQNTRFNIRSVFLEKNSEEATIFYSIFFEDNLDLNQMDGQDLIDNLYSSYRAYKAIRDEPLSFTQCAGLVRKLQEGVFEVFKCPNDGIIYITTQGD